MSGGIAVSHVISAVTQFSSVGCVHVPPLLVPGDATCASIVGIHVQHYIGLLYQTS